jgi:hypothetical protein
MAEESESKLPMSGRDFLEYLKTRNPDFPDLSKMSLNDIVSYIKTRYLKPNWLHWRNMAEVSLHQAVWLSFDVEPWREFSDVHNAVQGNSTQPSPMMFWHSAEVRNALRADYERRMEQCLSAINAKTLQVRWGNVVEQARAQDPGERWYLSLEHFRHWGESLRHPFTFPDEFPRPAAVPQTPTILLQEGAPTPYTSLSAPHKEVPSPSQDATAPAEASAADDDDEPDVRTRRTYVRTIRALAVMAKLIDEEGQVKTGAAGEIARKLQALGFETPKERALRNLLNEAASQTTDSD